MALCQAFAKTRISIFVAVVLQSQLLLFLLPVLSVFTVTQSFCPLLFLRYCSYLPLQLKMLMFLVT